jgi:cation diffusion facilitator CzcD-associated flavoprotein CzcO
MPVARDLTNIEIDIAIVGAGFAGLGIGIQLARRDKESFVILERAQEVGGTWRDNTYPGVACDIPSHLYSYSFRPPADWSRIYADGAEIQQYLQACVTAEGLAPHTRLGTDVQSMRWDPAQDRWELRTTAGDVRARFLVVAAGRLSEPNVADFPGLAEFSGPVFHTSRWDDGVQLAGRRVAVIGTGASAVQLLPSLADIAEHIVVFCRSAPYILPRNDRHYTEAERDEFRSDPSLARRLRERLFDDAELGIAARHGIHPDIDLLRDRARQHMTSQVRDPELRRRLTPNYEIGCKRVLLSDDFYATILRDNVLLESSGLDRVVGNIAVAGSENTHEVDAIILATGFRSTRPPFAESITGRDSSVLASRWSTGMTSYASTVVHGFPNMFVLDGPNASLGHNSAIYMIETQIDYVLGALDHLTNSGESTLEVTREAEATYTSFIDERARSTIWLQGGCQSWYLDERSGRLTLLWPDTAESFRDHNGIFDPLPFKVVA